MKQCHLQQHRWTRRSPCQVNCQAEKDKYMILLICRILKYNTNELIYKTVRDSQTSKTKLWLPGRKGGEGDRLRAWDGRVHTATFKTDNQQGPAAQHRGLCSALGASLGGRGVWLHVHLHVWLSLDCSPEPTATFLTGFTPIQNKKFEVWGKK